MLEANVIFQLREIGPDDLDAAEAKMLKASTPVAIEKSEKDGLFDVYTIASGKTTYRVIRFGYFALCECRDFAFSGTGCKHLPLTFPQVCRKCLRKAVPQRGAKCRACEMSDAPYMPPPPPTEYRSIKVGNIRV